MLQLLKLRFAVNTQFSTNFIDVSNLKIKCSVIFLTTHVLQVVMRYLIKALVLDKADPNQLSTISATSMEILALLLWDPQDQNLAAAIWARCSAKRLKCNQVLVNLVRQQKDEGKSLTGVKLDLDTFNLLVRAGRLLKQVIVLMEQYPAGFPLILNFVFKASC